MANVETITAKEFLATELSNGVVLDLRTLPEVKAESLLQDTVHLPVQDLTPESLSQAAGDLSGRTLFLLCQSGRRAVMATEKLSTVSNCQLVIIDGGLNDLKACGCDLKSMGKPVMLTSNTHIALYVLFVCKATNQKSQSPMSISASGGVGSRRPIGSSASRPANLELSACCGPQSEHVKGHRRGVPKLRTAYAWLIRSSVYIWVAYKLLFLVFGGGFREACWKV